MGMKQAVTALVSKGCSQSSLRDLSAFVIESLGNDDFLDSLGTEAGEPQKTHGQIFVRRLDLEAFFHEPIDPNRGWFAREQAVLL